MEVLCLCVVEDPGRMERSGGGGFGLADAPGPRGGRDEEETVAFCVFFLPLGS